MSGGRPDSGGGTRLAAIGFGVAVIGLALAVVVSLQALAQQQRNAVRLAATADSLRAALQGAPRGAPASGLHALRDDQLMELRRLGLADPIRDLHADLEKHPELIPEPAVAGGTMAFRGPITVLNERWVFATFEDGHIGGTMLLEYTVENGRIRWKRLAARLD